jgi:hypothetical protein
VLHYRARLQLAPTLREAPPAPRAPSSFEHQIPIIYDGKTLFHGPSFRTIISVRGVAADAAEASLRDRRALGWQDLELAADPVVIDGALQLAVLWSRYVMSADTLPLHVAAFRRYRAQPPRGDTRAVLRRVDVQSSHTCCDVAFLSSTGELIAELVGIHCYVRGDRAASTQRQAHAV